MLLDQGHSAQYVRNHHHPHSLFDIIFEHPLIPLHSNDASIQPCFLIKIPREDAKANPSVLNARLSCPEVGAQPEIDAANILYIFVCLYLYILILCL